jgi:regulatory protein
MPTITALETQKKNNARVNVYVDEAFFCGLTLDDVVRFRLSPGLQITESELTNLRESGEENKFFNKALVYLLKSPKTEFQIKQYLYKKQCPQEVSGQVIARLKKLNYINDADYARSYAENKSAKNGAKMIRAKLLQRGIGRDEADAVVQELSADTQTELARTLAQKYMRARAADQKAFSNLYRYLLGKGFDYDTARTAVDMFKDGGEGYND